MEKIIAFELSKKDAESFEELLDKTLNNLRRLEKESPARETRIAQSQSEVQTIKKEIREQLTILNERTIRLSSV